MNKFIAGLFGLGFLLFSVTAHGAKPVAELPELWTARNSVAFALANSPDSRVAMQRTVMARAAMDQARVPYYPHVDVSATYRQTNNPMYSFGNILNQGAFTPTIDFNDPGRTDDINFRAGVEYRFYNGGRDQAGVEVAEAGVAGSETDMSSIHGQLAFEVLKSFQSISQAQEMLAARKASLAAIESSLTVAKARYNAGDLLKADLLNLEVQQSSATEKLILAGHALELSKKVFLNLLGLREGVVNIDPDSCKELQLPEDRSYAARSELQSLLHAEEMAEAQLRIAQSGNLPTVDGFASYQYDKGWVMDGDGDSWMAGVKLNYRLFEGHRTAADIASGKAYLVSVRAQRDKMELRIDLEVKQADINYRQAVQRLQVTEKMVEQAEESARLSRTRFQEGVILSSDLINVETRLSDALVRQSVAKANIIVALADLRRAMGLAQFD
ncbi:MAG: TolC family protein [Desulfocapsa sp.]|nr:MAG: TolC family protein [Desulfocapsa sp.]